MASRGTQSKEAVRKRRLNQISRIKAEIKRLEAKTGKDKGGRTSKSISQLKKRLREIGGGGVAPKTYNIKKVKVKTSRGLRIRNVSPKKPDTKKKGMSNIPAGEESVNNPNLGKKGDLSMFKKDKSNKDTSKTENKKDSQNKKLKINPEKKVEKKVEKKDPLADYRRGPGTKLGKDTRITKRLKKSGFTEDRLARLRKQHAEFKAKRKKKKTS
tara:strand:+ start:63 stop:701 length:639 start_codon:yes stop_codon:yes gene_type:complete